MEKWLAGSGGVSQRGGGVPPRGAGGPSARHLLLLGGREWVGITGGFGAEERALL